MLISALGDCRKAVLLLALSLAQLVAGASQKKTIPGFEQVPSNMVLEAASPRGDPNSVANYHEFITRHLDLEWNVDFDQKKLSGSVVLKVERLSATENVLSLDASALEIHSIKDASNDNSLPYTYEPKGAEFGGILKIDLPPARVNAEHHILIKYETTEKSSALQWLTPEQTSGKKYPYLFSQCQAIHARTMVPCQDTPAVKAQYSATVSVPAPLTIVMSANERRQVQAGEQLNIYKFSQTTAIPSYLIAIVAGDVVATRVGPRSHVWSERELADSSQYEFADTESFIVTAEGLVGPYVWGIYDLLVLPPSFPYGGMENPCLTFVTPSLLAGDRSLVDVVAHEIAHSWTGNLVGCCSWEHFWLNEGFTMFLERKILSRLHGEPWRQFNSIIGLADLREAIKDFENRPAGTRLVTDNTHVDPDDYFSTIPYEKGYTFLYYLEKLVGGDEVFMPFFAKFISDHAHQAIDSNQFKNFAIKYFSAEAKTAELISTVDWDVWLYGEGMPPVVPEYDDELVKPCRELAQAWINGEETKASLYESFSAAQKSMFLDSLLVHADEVSSHMVELLQKTYALDECKNAEILLKWYLLAIRTRTRSVYQAAAKYASSYGRMKYCRPVLVGLFKADLEGRELALRTFKENMAFYHPIARQVIAKDLGLNY